MIMRLLLFSIQRIRIIAALFVFSVLSGCTDENSDWYFWDYVEIDLTEEPPPVVGDYYQGGIIIALDDSAKHGLIAAIEDQSSENPWYNGEFVQTNAVSTKNGSDNTEKILKAQGVNKPYAAKLCADYQFDGYSDWFLPSKDQLMILYQNKHLLDGLANEIYWSSTEHETGSAWVQNFSTGEQHINNTSDQAGVHTRAVREF